MKKTLILFLICCFVAVKAQPPRKFYTTWGGAGHDIGYGVIQTLDGQYAVTGSTSSFGYGNTDLYLAKIDSMGNPIWGKSYGGFNNDIGKSIIQLADSGYVMAGYTNSFGSGGYDVFVVRTDKNGNLTWQKAIGGMDWDFGYTVAQASDGGFVICGSTQSYGYGKTDGYIVKLDANGIFQWQKTYGGPEDDEFKSFVFTYNNMIAFAGTTKSMGDVKGDCWLFKTDLNGDSLLSVKYGDGKKQFINDIVEHPITKNFNLCGATDITGRDTAYAYILGLSETGSFLFEDYHSYKELKDEQYVALTYLKNDLFVYSRKNVHFPGGNRGYEPMISLYSNQFYIDATTYGSPEDDELFDVMRTRDKGFVLVGYTKGFNSLLSDIFLLKLDTGALQGAVSIVGIKEVVHNTNGIKVFPSLATDFVKIETGVPNKFEYSVINSFGNKVKTGFFSNSTEIDLEGLPDGIYFISISDRNLSYSHKIIKQN